MARTARVVPTLLLTCALAALTALASPPPVNARPAPGTVFDVTPLDTELSLPGASSARVLDYATQWRAGIPARATGALFLPRGTAPEGGWPVVTWAHGTVGLADSCAPSRLPRTPRDTAYLDHWLAQGYAVAAADYPGLGSEGVHRYLDGQSAANSVIDIVRAGRAVEPALSDRWVVIGQSQGGHAALHTAHAATTRAPELDFRGALTTGAPSNLERVFPLGSPGFPDLGLEGLTAFAAYIFAGLRDADPDLDVDAYLTDLGREVVDGAEQLCYDELIDRFGGIGIGEILARPLSDDRFRAAFTDYLAVPTRGYDRPLFLAQGLGDTTVPAPLAFALVAELWAGGAHAQFRTYPTGHSETMFASLPDTTGFVADLLRP
ncbi:lipase family protein [Rhodococcus sp. CH91]|uniref:lipase family protein n=1 Tax=Rhodococcus sp. CH91 TaxID=2910256 RepID=UPI001F4B4D14|nr:lipase family protein [Rhodococcus sp. CH91]